LSSRLLDLNRSNMVFTSMWEPRQV
jgi:hypothetical protein